MSNLSINDLDTGISSAGMDEYVESLKTNLIIETEKLIDNVSEIESVLNAGWQGVAKDHYLERFKNFRTLVKEELEKEHQNLLNRLTELEHEYFEIDQSLATELE